MDTLDKFTRSVKAFYQEMGNLLEGGKQGIDTFLFGSDDVDTVSNFTLDKLIVNPHGVAFRHRDEQSKVREYEAGSGTVYEVPHVSEKTPISEELRDSVVAGIESTAGFPTHEQKLITDIINQHVAAYTSSRWKIALDTIRTGIFSPKGLNGNDIGLSINYGRDSSLSITYDFTAVGATIDKALKDLYDTYLTNGGNPQEMVIIAGSKWLQEFQNDEAVLTRMQANAANILIRQPLMPPELLGTQGLYLVADYLIPGTLTPVYICGYRPRYEYIAYPGATAEEYMPEGEAIVMSIGEKETRFRVFRGVDALSGNGEILRTAGEMVFDSFVSQDPVTEYLRSQSRFAFVPGNINRTGRSVGTFDEES